MRSDLRPPAAVRGDALSSLGLPDEAGQRLHVDDPVLDDDTLVLRYRLDGVARLEERFRFEGLPASVPAERRELAQQAARYAALFAATSYYKTVLPRALDVAFPVSDPVRDLTVEVFEEGLGEFAYRNGTTLRGHLRIEAPTGSLDASGDVDLADRPLVPVGGGKDSIVTLEAVRRELPDVRTFAVNPRGPITRTVEHAGTAHLAAHRTLAPELFELNDRGALNGHVPITAIVSAVAVVGAVLCGDRWVVMSNEASADQGNVTVDGIEVNHQYAKSASFERRFAACLRRELHPELGYLSLLRPAGELAIARAFARLPDYHGIFNSCNRAFKLRGTTTEWCGECPKCRFVFLVLAPFLERETLLEVFSGRDLLDDPEQERGYRELLGLTDVKPWECVGTFEESQAAVGCLAERPAWRDSRLVGALADEVDGGCDDVERLAGDVDAGSLPAPFDRILDAAL